MQNKLKTELEIKNLKQKKEPIRLCVVCREKNSKKNLIRIVKEKTGRIFVDYFKKAPGKGAYLCFKDSCFKMLKKKKGLEKAFKCKINETVYFELEKIIKNLTDFK